MTNDAIAAHDELTAALQRADPEAFVTNLWAANALQSGRSATAMPYLRRIPTDAATDGILGPHAIYPWELETLANELFAVPRPTFASLIDFGDWPRLAWLANVLRSIEGAEYQDRRSGQDIFRELGRVGARQFEWQRGFNTTAEFYRSVVIYGQGECDRFLRERHGVTAADMTFVGYGLMALMLQDPSLRPRVDLEVLEEFGVSKIAIGRVLDRIAAPIDLVRAGAAELRRWGAGNAYAPSILRRYPAILMGAGQRRLRAPLPELLVARVTSGLFYDVVEGGGPVRAEYGGNFETYTHRLLSAMIPDLDLRREWEYRTGGSTSRTPDLISLDARGSVDLVMECKAARMSVTARFGEDPSGERGYEEMAKGVTQIWRFFSHCRRGLTGRAATSEAKGLLVCLDDWFLARSTMAEDVLARAHVRADAVDGGIPAEDRRLVGFASINEMEMALRRATRKTFMQAVDVAASPDRLGWMFQLLHDEFVAEGSERRPYPFDDELEELLPWWRLLRLARGQDRERGVHRF